MILNSNTLDRISKKMIIEMKQETRTHSRRNLCELFQYFSVDNKIQTDLTEDVELKNKEAICRFHSIGSHTDKKVYEYSRKPKCVSFYSQKERDMLIKELFSVGSACKYPVFLKINNNYYFLNELKFIEYNKEQTTELVCEKYDELDCFMIENLYGVGELKKKGYKKEGKQYKLLPPYFYAV